MEYNFLIFCLTIASFSSVLDKVQPNSFKWDTLRRQENDLTGNAATVNLERVRPTRNATELYHKGDTSTNKSSESDESRKVKRKDSRHSSEKSREKERNIKDSAEVDGNGFHGYRRLIIIGLLLLLTLIMLAIICYILYRRIYNRKRTIFDAAHNAARPHNSYVTEDIINDLDIFKTNTQTDPWLMSRNRVEVYLDQKLGTGSSNCDVYKGRITGKSAIQNVFPNLIAINGFRDCEVAVKLLPPFADSITRLDFEQEISYMKSLHFHPHLVTMLGCVMDSPQPMLVLEYCSHGDLLHFIRRHREEIIAGFENSGSTGLKIKDLVSFAWQISSGLHYLSDQGCIHRDIAARNVLLDSANVCKISDFGMCRTADDLLYTTRSGGRVPLRWLSIETLEKFEYSSKSDIWSYGVLLFEMFSLGEVPYADIENSDLLPFLKNGRRLSQPEQCTEEMYSLMSSCWLVPAELRPTFNSISEKIAQILEDCSPLYGYIIATHQ
ncbi:protein tyrosine kinase domain-containing protein [Ditylenchus destructor]|uniref:Protein tyrosine kinase domain-containing protein n=1 Tax=Ditylenchus destructor TaxID=166010 RepID=A0AAD4NAJ2_9BILA|nr:protein tyrosine kinase domain-containing protein [Ditylenchus destructor]